jgi:Protein of unknown function (DUF2975)
MNATRQSRAVNLGYALLNLVLLAAVAFAALQIVNPAVGAARDGRMLVGATIPAKLQISPQRIHLPPGLRHDGWLATTAQVKHPTAAQEALAAAMDLTQLTLFIAVLWLLRGIVRSVRLGEPFGAGTVRRLRGIAGVLLIGAPIVEAINEGLRTELFDRLSPAQQTGVGTAGYTIPGALLIAGLGALILAEVFAQGLRLREDVEGTV